MGAWRFIREAVLDGQGDVGDRVLRYVGRGSSAAPAPGSIRTHLAEQEALVEEREKLDAIETAELVLERGGAVCIFPEGTRVRGKLGEANAYGPSPLLRGFYFTAAGGAGERTANEAGADERELHITSASAVRKRSFSSGRPTVTRRCRGRP